MIEAAIQAPSAVNAQPWLFTIIRNQALLGHISQAAKAHMLKAGAAVAPGFAEHLTNPDFHIFYHAPAVIVISATDAGWAVEDAALAAENLMLAACAQGLGSCWIGFAQRWLETEEGKRAIDLPGDCRPVAPIVVGHPAEPAPAVLRHIPTIRWLG